jgi:PAS domain S-box-containing protein
VPRLLNGVSSSVWLTDPATGELVCRHAVGIQSETLRDQRLKPGEGLSGWVIAHGESVIVPDAKADQRHFGGVDEQRGLTVRSFLSVPLRFRESVIGVLNAADMAVNRFSATDRMLLELLAASGAIAIQNARLFAERKQAEEALAHEQYLMQTLMDNIPDHIYFKDRASRFIRTSKAHAQSFGLSEPAQMAGKTDFDFFTEEHARVAYEDEQRIIQTGQPLMNIEEKETRPSRPDTWALTTKMPLRDKEGQIIGTFGISKDITERKWAEAERERLLAETEALYQSSAAIKQAQTYDEVLTALREHTLLGQADMGASINLFDRPWTSDQEPSWAFVPARWSILPSENLPKRHPLNASFKKLWRPDAPTIIQDIEHDQRLDEQIRIQFTRDYHGGSLIYAPMVAGGQWIGNFYAIWSRPNQFSEADVRRMMSLVGQAAAAVENIRRLEETQNRARREQMLNEMTNRIRTGITLEQVLNATVQEVGTALGAERVAVRLEPIGGDPQGAFGSG